MQKLAQNMMYGKPQIRMSIRITITQYFLLYIKGCDMLELWKIRLSKIISLGNCSFMYFMHTYRCIWTVEKNDNQIQNDAFTFPYLKSSRRPSPRANQSQSLKIFTADRSTKVSPNSWIFSKLVQASKTTLNKRLWLNISMETCLVDSQLHFDV